MSPPDPRSAAVTGLLHRCRQDDASATAELSAVLCGELRRMARGYLRHERAAHTLQPTALVHEAYAQLAGEP